MTAINYRSADVDGVKVFYREAGAAGAPALLLLHGFPSASQYVPGSHSPSGLRVYVDNGYGVGSPIVPGTLTGQATILQGVATYSPINQEEPDSPGYIASRPAATIDRGNINHTLNFLIPGNWCGSGKMPIEINVRLASEDQPSDQILIYADFRSVPDPKVHAVLVNYTGKDVVGSDLNIPAPTSTDFINTINLARGPYPVRSFDITGFSTIQFSGNLDSPPLEWRLRKRME